MAIADSLCEVGQGRTEAVKSTSFLTVQCLVCVRLVVPCTANAVLCYCGVKLQLTYLPTKDL